MQGTVQLLTQKREAGTVAYLRLDRPSKRNALTSEMLSLLRQHAEDLAGDRSLRAVVLSGAGSCFAAGADIGELSDLDAQTAESFIRRLQAAHAALRALPVPVIAQVHGACLGAAMEMAASCDLRIATRGALFGMPEVRVGLPSVIEAALLPRLLGWGKASDLMLCGEPMDGAEAHRCGFVQRLAEEGEQDAVTERCVSAILQGGARAVRLQKALFAQWERGSLEEAIEHGVAAMVSAYETDEPRNLQKRFLSARQLQKTHA